MVGWRVLAAAHDKPWHVCLHKQTISNWLIFERRDSRLGVYGAIKGLLPTVFLDSSLEMPEEDAKWFVDLLGVHGILCAWPYPRPASGQDADLAIGGTPTESVGPRLGTPFPGSVSCCPVERLLCVANEAAEAGHVLGPGSQCRSAQHAVRRAMMCVRS